MQYQYCMHILYSLVQLLRNVTENIITSVQANSSHLSSMCQNNTSVVCHIIYNVIGDKGGITAVWAIQYIYSQGGWA